MYIMFNNKILHFDHWNHNQSQKKFYKNIGNVKNLFKSIWKEILVLNKNFVFNLQEESKVTEGKSEKRTWEITKAVH